MLRSARISLLLLVIVVFRIISAVSIARPFPKGDLNEDCKVNFEDLRHFAQQWLDVNCLALDCEADLDSIRGVDMSDFACLADNWFKGRCEVTLVINEFMASNNRESGVRDEHGDYDDWIEIYNYGDDAVNMAGMYLIDDKNEPAKWRVPANNPSATTIPAGGYLIIWADDETHEGTLHASFKLSASSGEDDVCLFDTDGNTPIDGILDFPAQEQNKSYGRLPDASDNWQVFKGPTPWKTNGIPPPSILISEIMYHPYHSTSGNIAPENIQEEYIELFNRGNGRVDLAGWRFSDGVDFTFPDIALGSGEYLVVAADVNTFKAKHPGVDNVTGGWAGRLSNQSEAIELVDAAGVRIDRVRYADEGDWATRVLGPEDHYHRGWVWSDEHDGGGRSLELINPELPNDYGQNWAASDVNEGTPGAANSAADNDIAPLILDVEHCPIIPGPNDLATVTARIIDERPTGINVTLHYSRDSSTYEGETVPPHYDAGDYNDTAMFDDGAHGDGQAGDGAYGARIPAHPNGTIIEFYVEARDAAANLRTWPAPSLVDGAPEQVTNALYQVDASFDPNAPWIPGSQPVNYLIATNAEMQELSDIGDLDYGGNVFASEAMSDAQMNATFISVDGVDTKVRYTVGVRNRGHRSRADPPMNYRVNFPHDQPWKGITALNINSKYPHLQLIGSALFQLAGLPAANATVVQLRVNGLNLAADDYSRMFGSYVALEAYDGDWTNNHIPDDDAGNLYRCTFYYDGFNPESFADLYYKEGPGETPNPDDYRHNYRKQTNTAEDDWSDLLGLIDKLNNPDIADANFVREISRVINLEKWVRYLAADALAGNRESGLNTGMGDDYTLYRGVEDRRFWLLPHDLDAVLGHGAPGYQPQSDIFAYADVAGLSRLLNDPDVIRLYYNQYPELINTVFAPENILPMVDRLLGGWVSRSQTEGPNGIKQFVIERANSILHGGYPSEANDPQIPQDFSIDCDLPMVGGFHRTDTNVAALGGTANAIETRSVRVNGRSAQDSNWSQRNGTWSIADIALNPGINRIIVQTYDGREGTGNELRYAYIDIWYDDDVTEISGTLTSDKTFDAASGPWRVNGDLTVSSGTTLTIEPGTTVYVGQGVQLIVRGRLAAEGTQYRRIRLTREPGSSSTWGGLSFNSVEDNRLSYVDMEYSSAGNRSISLDSSRILIDNVTWAGTDETILSISNSSLVVRNSVFPDTKVQTVSGHRLLPSDPYMLFENNLFGVCGGHKQDVVDFSTSGSAVMPRFINNTFLGGGDDGFDLDGTNAYLEGNVFMNFHRNFSPEDGESYAITTGYDGSHSSNHVIARNLFVDCDNAVLVKDQSWITFVNNTVVGCTGAGINFDEPLESGIDPGAGGYLEGNIFWDTPMPLAHFYVDDPVWGTTDITVNHSIIPLPWQHFGEGNLDVNPQFVDPNGDFRLKSSSPARGAGSCGLDMGAYVPAGACTSGEPDQITYRPTATLTVGGPGITHYRYSINDTGSWGGELSADMPIELTGLADGQSYTVYVKGKNAAGVWQSDPCYVPSRTWTVDTSYSRLVINEILAHTHGADPDIIELHYDGPRSIDLAGMSLTDDSTEPNKFVFSSASAAATIMNPGDYVVLYGDLNTHLKNHLGFALSAEGERLYLYDKPTNGGGLIDSVVFGPQMNDFSIGRIGYDGAWRLNKPTFGQVNVAQPLGDPEQLKINEWLAGETVLFSEDYVELYNPCDLPVDLSQLYLTDNPVTQPAKQELGPLSFIASGGFTVFVADDDSAPGHLGFRLSADGGMLGLFDAQLNGIDKVIYGPQTPDVSEGRVPDGKNSFDFCMLPTPRAANPVPTITSTTLVAENDNKRVLVPTGDIGIAWETDPNFDDLGWTLCTGSPGGVGYERRPGDPVNYVNLITLGVEPAMYGRNASCYIRIPFAVDVAPSSFTGMVLRVRYDDGFVAYVNGVRVAGRNFDGAPRWNSMAVRSHDDPHAVFFEDIDISSYIGALRQGDNVLAIHAMNVHPSSFDFLISADLVAIVTKWDEPVTEAFALLDGLRITELMYHDVNGSTFDFIELKNVGDVVLNLDGVRFTEGIEFTFPAMALDPGQYVVVVKDENAFQDEYGKKNVAGRYANNLDNGGEEIVLQLPWPYEASIMRFEYDDTWYPSTDGQGDSLVIVDPYVHPVTWNHPENWRADSPTPGGE